MRFTWQVAYNERPRLITEAETEKREAETQAQIIKDKADSDARILANRYNHISHKS
jgi:hypothetical protein